MEYNYDFWYTRFENGNFSILYKNWDFPLLQMQAKCNFAIIGSENGFFFEHSTGLLSSSVSAFFGIGA